MGRILVIEDDAQIRANLVRMLRLEGHQVDEAADGEDGVERALRSPPDLVLCDVMMPRLDGFGVLQRLRGDPQTRDVPFVFLTASAERERAEEALAAGAQDYLVKPFTLDEMRQLLRRYGDAAG